MTIQRQYNLPNCTLVLEGLSDAPLLATATPEARPLMSVLLNAQCYLSGQEKPLAGGREFLENLITSVSQYTQGFLSGIHLPLSAAVTPLVQLQPVNNRHRLSVRTQEAASPSQPPDQQVDLTTVQLFDLVEAVDQLLADSQTLPDLTLSLKPVSKRYTRSEDSTKRIIPAAIGASGVALAALGLFFIPVPKITQPECVFPTEKCRQADPKTNPTASPSAGASPNPSPASAAASPSPSASPAASPSPAATQQPDLNQLKQTVNSTPDITDAAKLDELGKQLRDRVDKSWKTRQPPSDLVYKVGVTQDGSIVGYDFVNDAALSNVKLTPLLDLLYLTPGGQATAEPTAKFKLVFTPNGNVEVAPWNAVMANPTGGANEITDSQQIDTLLPKVYETIDREWGSAKPPFEKPLIYRVRVRADGTIADYRPENQPAFDYPQDTPLPKLGKRAEETDAPPQESLALFKVVFNPDGKLEVSPWRGRRR